ncbi:hypothetical protein AAG906_031460 [Vitis piasezkii]
MASLKAQKPLTTQPAGQVKKEPAKPSGNPQPSHPGLQAWPQEGRAQTPGAQEGTG